MSDSSRIECPGVAIFKRTQPTFPTAVGETIPDSPPIVVRETWCMQQCPAHHETPRVRRSSAAIMSLGVAIPDPPAISSPWTVSSFTTSFTRPATHCAQQSPKKLGPGVQELAPIHGSAGGFSHEQLPGWDFDIISLGVLLDGKEQLAKSMYRSSTLNGAASKTVTWRNNPSMTVLSGSRGASKAAMRHAVPPWQSDGTVVRTVSGGKASPSACPATSGSGAEARTKSGPACQATIVLPVTRRDAKICTRSSPAGATSSMPYDENHGMPIEEFIIAYNEGYFEHGALGKYFLLGRAARQLGSSQHSHAARCAPLATCWNYTPRIVPGGDADPSACSAAPGCVIVARTASGTATSATPQPLQNTDNPRHSRPPGAYKNGNELTVAEPADGSPRLEPLPRRIVTQNPLIFDDSLSVEPYEHPDLNYSIVEDEDPAETGIAEEEDEKVETNIPTVKKGSLTLWMEELHSDASSGRTRYRTDSVGIAPEPETTQCTTYASRQGKADQITVRPDCRVQHDRGPVPGEALSPHRFHSNLRPYAETRGMTIEEFIIADIENHGQERALEEYFLHDYAAERVGELPARL
ncbi:hypothetical protein FPV67DRAFT_1460873 [Lyophyllum atratum]|nr:hypothetical protein FPV67DRAFT_1460873 [Lyophyllum atratum]